MRIRAEKNGKQRVGINRGSKSVAIIMSCVSLTSHVLNASA